MGWVHIQGENKEHRVTIYATSCCTPCRKTRELLDSRSIEYKYINIDAAELEERDEAMMEIGEHLPSIGMKITYPIVIIDENTVFYGYDEKQLSESLGIH